jgi:hypothetical protein
VENISIFKMPGSADITFGTMPEAKQNLLNSVDERGQSNHLVVFEGSYGGIQIQDLRQLGESREFLSSKATNLKSMKIN